MTKSKISITRNIKGSSLRRKYINNMNKMATNAYLSTITLFLWIKELHSDIIYVHIIDSDIIYMP